jgi:soluble lytic murein transglycosylase
MKFFLFLLLSLPLVAAADQDDDFLAARDAFRAGNAVRFERLAAHLKNSPLEPYIAYYRLRMQLETADAAAVQAFLARTDDTPVVDRLRGEWLKLLGKRQQWDAFEAEYPRLLNTDTELECYRMQARLRTQEAEVLQEARRLWLSSGDAQPDSCAPPFGAALAAGAISEADIGWRMRLALEAGNVSLAEQWSERLPAGRRPPAKALSSAAADPMRYLNHAKLEGATEAERGVALFALQRLAKQLPQLAFNQWEKISANFTVAEQQYFYTWLAYEAALKQDARALEWFKMAGDAPLTEPQRAWRARAALRLLNWQEVHNSIAAMSPQQQQDGAWCYWNARALRHLGRAEEADKILSALSGEYNFYGQLAADEVGVASAPAPASYRPAKEELGSMQALPPIQRALALYRMDLRPTQ